MSQHEQIATFAGGCFWCTEAIFKRLKGVSRVVPGYSGGTTENPTYAQLHEQETGHAESIQVTFDPTIISYDKLLDVFFGTHDPTTLNRQGADQGTEYRSVIFYHDEKQKEEALAKKKQLEDKKKFADPIVTEIIPYTKFYPAEESHQDYYARNPNAPYCMVVIDPKIQKLKKHFTEDVKEEYK